MIGYKEKDLLWWRKGVRTKKKLYRLIRKAANKLGWDPQIVEGLVESYGYAYNSPTNEIGWQIDWFDEEEVRIYFYTREKEELS